MLMDVKYVGYAVIAVLGGVVYSNPYAVERALMQAFSQSTAAQRLAVLYTQGTLLGFISKLIFKANAKLQRVRTAALQHLEVAKVDRLCSCSLVVPCSSIQSADALSGFRVSNEPVHVRTASTWLVTQALLAVAYESCTHQCLYAMLEKG
jgi:hypothetical protein